MNQVGWGSSSRKKLRKKRQEGKGNLSHRYEKFSRRKRQTLLILFSHLTSSQCCKAVRLQLTKFGDFPLTPPSDGSCCWCSVVRNASTAGILAPGSCVRFLDIVVLMMCAYRHFELSINRKCCTAVGCYIVDPRRHVLNSKEESLCE